MARLVTTNLRFPEATYRELRYRAHRRSVPVALLVREAVDRYLGRTEDDATEIPFGSDPADAFIGCFASGVDDESINHDHYLYGWPKESDEKAPGRQRRVSGARGSRRSPSSGGDRLRATASQLEVRSDRADRHRGRDAR